MSFRFEKSTASIAAWNLATFSKPDDTRITLQGKGLGYLDAELVVLVEIRNTDHLDKLVDHLSRKGVTYRHHFIPQQEPNRDHAAMHIGILCKDGVEVSNPKLLVDSNLGTSRHRQAYTADIKIGNFDFHLIAVHLKSGRSQDDQTIRDEQCKVIGQYITDLRGVQNRNPDILLAGDFNMIPGQDISNFHHLGGNDIMDFISSWDLQERYSHILPSGRENLLDGFAISKRFSTEYIRGSLRLFPMHWHMRMGQDKYRREVSDHLPFIARFAISSDRD